jgi:dihydropteroate synthase
MLVEGAQILDIGGMSSKPGAEELPIQEEIDRVAPVIIALKKEFPKAILSIDTYRSEVADFALQQGADILNDISGAELDARHPCSSSKTSRAIHLYAYARLAKNDATQPRTMMLL